MLKMGWRLSVKVGDLVICNCAANVWYRGEVGMLVDFDTCTKDPIVLYFNGEVVRLAYQALEVIS